MTFTPGQPVAFVDDTNLGTLGYGDEVYPTLGETYTVRDVVLDHFGAEGLLLAEIRNDRLPYRVGDKIVDFEKPFASWRFRPVVGGENVREMEAAYGDIRKPEREGYLGGQARQRPRLQTG